MFFLEHMDAPLPTALTENYPEEVMMIVDSDI